MYANRLCVEIQVQCGECDRVDRVVARLGHMKSGLLTLTFDSVPVPEGWVKKQVDRDTWELFCPAHHREVRL
jgi:hypothetical protein